MLRRESSSLLAPPELVAEGGSVGRMRRVGQAELLALGPPQAAGHRPGPAAAGPTVPRGRSCRPHGPRWAEGARGSRTWAV